jgi:predicted transcriptional regulator
MRERMSPDLEFDVDRYRQLLAEATDEKKRLALIELLVEERAKGRLEAARSSERDVETVVTIVRVLGISKT